VRYLVTSIIIFSALILGAAQYDDEFKPNKHTGKPDNIGVFNRYSSKFLKKTDIGAGLPIPPDAINTYILSTQGGSLAWILYATIDTGAVLFGGDSTTFGGDTTSW
jgi:hypothetical protein